MTHRMLTSIPETQKSVYNSNPFRQIEVTEKVLGSMLPKDVR